ncbi:hypothetical protein RND81_01G054600 [Saponaria officinalis]|uniref:Uncharacterized protein n=1 Tax=Saponaria officinalis TaxID=3572 RepID=A0AAW1N8T6_SAPOF
MLHLIMENSSLFGTPLSYMNRRLPVGVVSANATLVLLLLNVWTTNACINFSWGLIPLFTVTSAFPNFNLILFRLLVWLIILFYKKNGSKPSHNLTCLRWLFLLPLLPPPTGVSSEIRSAVSAALCFALTVRLMVMRCLSVFLRLIVFLNGGAIDPVLWLNIVALGQVVLVAPARQTLVPRVLVQVVVLTLLSTPMLSSLVLLFTLCFLSIVSAVCVLG